MLSESFLAQPGTRYRFNLHPTSTRENSSRNAFGRRVFHADFLLPICISFPPMFSRRVFWPLFHEWHWDVPSADLRVEESDPLYLVVYQTVPPPQRAFSSVPRGSRQLVVPRTGEVGCFPLWKSSPREKRPFEPAASPLPRTFEFRHGLVSRLCAWPPLKRLQTL